MEKNKNVPPLRFAGFTDDWEQRKLGEIVHFYSGLTYSPNNVVENGTLVLRSSNVQENQIVTDDSVFVDPNVVNSDNVQIGDIIVVVRNGSKNLIGKHARIQSVMSNTVIGAFMTGIRSPNPEFLSALLDTQKFNDEIDKNLGATINQITTGNFKQMEFSFPSEEEQTAIGNFFKQLDETIALHQRECEKYQNLKKSYLDKMFPKENKLFPELRFPEFTDAWEQRKLGDILSESRIYGSNGKNANKLTVKLWGKGVVAKDDLLQGSEATQYFIRKAGQFIYGKLDFLNQAFGIIPDKLDGYESTLDAPAFDIDTNVNSNFLLEYISRENFYLHYGNLANGSRKAKRVHTNVVLDMPFIAPSFEEQTAIGNFFKQLDETIALHQRELEKYKQIKQSYLEKMFV